MVRRSKWLSIRCQVKGFFVSIKRFFNRLGNAIWGAIKGIFKGFVLGALALFCICACCVGLSILGPIAGGAFARSQGGGVTAGSPMALC